MGTVPKSATIGSSRAVRGFLRQPMPLPSARDLPTRTLHGLLRSLWAGALLLAALPALAAGPPYAGQPLRAVLEDLGTKGLHLVYSSEVVPDSLRVKTEPAAGPPLQLLQEVLAQQGLEAKPVGADTYAVVRGAAPVKAAPARPVPDDPVPLEEVVVAASRYSLSSEIPNAHTVFTQDEIRQLPRLADDSLKAVHRLPAAASNGVSGLAYMRGGANNETLVTLDGFALYEPFHLKLLLSPTSLLDPGILNGMDVHAGGFTADFGDRMSSVIEATSIHPEADQHYELGLSLFNASLVAFNRFADGAGQWLVAARAQQPRRDRGPGRRALRRDSATRMRSAGSIMPSPRIRAAACTCCCRRTMPT